MPLPNMLTGTCRVCCKFDNRTADELVELIDPLRRKDVDGLGNYVMGQSMVDGLASPVCSILISVQLEEPAVRRGASRVKHRENMNTEILNIPQERMSRW